MDVEKEEPEEVLSWDIDEAYAQGRENGLQDRHHSICPYGAVNTLADVWWLGWRHGSILARKRHALREINREVEESGMKVMQQYYTEHPEMRGKDLCG